MTETPEEAMQQTPEGIDRERLDLPGKGGVDIPIPTRDRVYSDLAKVAKPRKKPTLRERLRGPKE